MYIYNSLLMVRTLTIYSLNNFHIYHTAVLALVIMPYTRSLARLLFMEWGLQSNWGKGVTQ